MNLTTCPAHSNLGIGAYWPLCWWTHHNSLTFQTPFLYGLKPVLPSLLCFEVWDYKPFVTNFASWKEEGSRYHCEVLQATCQFCIVEWRMKKLCWLDIKVANRNRYTTVSGDPGTWSVLTKRSHEQEVDGKAQPLLLPSPFISLEAFNNWSYALFLCPNSTIMTPPPPWFW